jgi:hypothetical protein
MMKKIKWPGRAKLENSANILTLVSEGIRYFPGWILKLFN